MTALLTVGQMPPVRGFAGPRDLYTVLDKPALLAGMSMPARSTDWSALWDAGFRHVVCLTESAPDYDPSPLRIAHAAALEDLVHKGPPRDAVREASLVRAAALAATSKVMAGEGVIIHCLGGTGRTGTVIGCVLRLLGCDGDNVVKYLDKLNRQERKRHGWPESAWQAEQVRAFIPRIARVGAESIPVVMRLERLPGYDRLVGCWSEAQHVAALADPGNAYLLGYDGEHPRGFAIACTLDDPHGNVVLKRLAVEQAGEGFGRGFVHALTDWAFTTTQAHRLWLDVLEHNARARHVYRQIGFTEDGVWRQSYRMPDGARISQILMAMLRPEWEARRPARTR